MLMLLQQTFTIMLSSVIFFQLVLTESRNR